MPSNATVTTERDQSPNVSSFARTERLRGIFFLIAALLLLAPIWIVHYAPLIDYPNHLARTFVLAHLHDPAYQFDSWYRANWGPYPYLTMDLLLIGFQKVVGIYTASKLLLSLTVVGVPLSIWTFARKANPGQDALSLWSLPIAYGTFFLMGSISMRMSMALMFATLALWLHFLERPSVHHLGVRQQLALLAMVTLVYFTHVFGFALMGAAMTIYALLTRRSWRILLATWLCYIPGAVLYLYVKLDIPAPRMFITRDLGAKITGLTAILRGYSNPLDLLTYLAILLCIVVAIWRNPEFRLNRAWFAVVVVFFVGYWFAPIVLGEAWDVDIRLLEFALAFLVVAARVGKRARLIGAIALLVFAVRMGNTLYNFRVEERAQQQLALGSTAIDQNARVMPIINSTGDRQFRKTYLHFWSYGVIDRGWKVPSLFHDAGVHTIANKLPVYDPVSFASPGFKRERQWDLVQRDYDFLWTYNVPYLYREIEKVADPVFTQGNLRIFKMRAVAAK